MGENSVVVQDGLPADARGVVLAPGARLTDTSGDMRTATGTASFSTVFDRGIFVDSRCSCAT